MPRLRYYLLLFICLIIIVNTVRSLGDYFKAGNRLELARDKFDQAKADNDRLKREKVKVDSPDFVEEEARNRLGMSRPGEMVVVLPEELQQPLPGVPRDDKPNWKRWVELFL